MEDNYNSERAINSLRTCDGLDRLEASCGAPAGGAPGPKFIFQQVPEGRAAGKNRLHVDIEVGDDLDSECDRLVGLGARRVSDRIAEAGTDWIVMADPEGNEFCLVHH